MNAVRITRIDRVSAPVRTSGAQVLANFDFTHAGIEVMGCLLLRLERGDFVFQTPLFERGSRGGRQWRRQAERLRFTDMDLVRRITSAAASAFEALL